MTTTFQDLFVQYIQFRLKLLKRRRKKPRKNSASDWKINFKIEKITTKIGLHCIHVSLKIDSSL